MQLEQDRVFNIVEVMSMSRFSYKRIGYLAAAQSFTQQTEVVLLCTNLLKKELQSKNPYAIGLAINCLSNVCTPDLVSEHTCPGVSLAFC